MSAEAFGAKLLSEVYEESLASLLSDLRAFYNPRPTVVTNVPDFDKLVEQHRFPKTRHDPDATSDELTIPSDDYPYRADLDEDLDEGTSSARARSRRVKQPKPVIINVSQSSDGPIFATKSLIFHLLTLSILPPELGGKHETVVYIDSSNTFSTSDLVSAVFSLAQSTSLADPDHEHSSTIVKQAVREAIHHVHILQCPSTKTLLDGLRGLPQYLLDPTAHQSGHRKLGMIVVESINHFYWRDRFDAELARLEGISIGNASVRTSSTSAESMATQILKELKSLQSTFESTVIYTTTPSSTLDSSTGSAPSYAGDTVSPFATSGLNPIVDIYSQSALFNIQLAQKVIPQFAPHMSIEDCLRDREKRDEAVEKAEYWVRAWGGGLSEQKQDSRASHQHEVAFSIRLLDDGGITVE